TGAATPVSGRMKPTLIGPVEATPEAAAPDAAALADAAAGLDAAEGLAAAEAGAAALLTGAADGAAPPQAASRERARRAPARSASGRRVLFTSGIVQPARQAGLSRPT